MTLHMDLVRLTPNQAGELPVGGGGMTSCFRDFVCPAVRAAARRWASPSQWGHWGQCGQCGHRARIDQMERGPGRARFPHRRSESASHTGCRRIAAGLEREHRMASPTGWCTRHAFAALMRAGNHVVPCITHGGGNCADSNQEMANGDRWSREYAMERSRPRDHSSRQRTFRKTARCRRAKSGHVDVACVRGDPPSP
jgi:hypothetical protein